MFEEFKGKRASDIVHYMDHHLMAEQPHSVMFICGGNDIPYSEVSPERIKSMANRLIDAGIRCKNNFGVTEVFISSILPRSNNEFQTNRFHLNNLLRELCLRNNFTFMENKGISVKSHLLPDGVHLNKRGTDVLCTNILDYINDK